MISEEALKETFDRLHEEDCIEYELGVDGFWRKDFDLLDGYTKRRLWKVKIGGRVLQLEQGTRAGPGTTGADIWDAAIVLSRMMEVQATSWVVGRRVVEVGCGVGLGSWAAAALGAKEVVATDRPLPFLKELWARNLRRNHFASINLRFDPLDWAALPPSPPGAPADLIIASDVIYEDGQPELLVAALRFLTQGAAPPPAEQPAFLLAAEDSSRRGFAHFLHLLEPYFTLEELVSPSILPPEWRNSAVHVRLFRKSHAYSGNSETQ